MGAMKDYMMKIEDLIYNALELGCRGENEVFSYVYMYEKNVDRSSVNVIFERIIDQLDETDRMYYNTTFN